MRNVRRHVSTAVAVLMAGATLASPAQAAAQSDARVAFATPRAAVGIGAAVDGSKIVFKSNSYALSATVKKAIAAVAKANAGSPRLDLTAYTQSTSKEIKNKNLGRKRGAAVAAAFKKAGYKGVINVYIGGPAGTSTKARRVAVVASVKKRITFDTGTGSGPTSLEFWTGEPISAPAAPAARSNLVFAGWSVTAASAATAFSAAAVGGTAVTFPYTHPNASDFTFYALWEANPRLLTIDPLSFVGTYYTNDHPTVTATAAVGDAFGTKTFTTSTPSVCYVTSGGDVTFVGIGTCTVTAAITAATDGDQSFPADTSPPVSVTSAKTARSAILTVPASATGQVANSFRFDERPTMASSVSPTGGVLTWSVETPLLASPTCSISTLGVVTFLNTGECTVKATHSATAVFDAAVATATLTSVARASSVSINSGYLSSYALNAATPPTLAATVAAGAGSVTWVLDNGTRPGTVANATGVCTVNASTGAIQLTGLGTCSVFAKVSASTGYAEAYSSSPASFSVTRIPRTLSISVPALTGGATAYSYSDSAPRAALIDSCTGTVAECGTVLFGVEATSDLGVCSVAADGQITFTAKGTCKIVAHIGVVGNYLDSQSNVLTLTVDARGVPAQPKDISTVAGTLASALSYEPVVTSPQYVTAISCKVYNTTYPTDTTEVTGTLHLGSYKIHCDNATPMNSNYVISAYVDGVLSVTAIPRTWTWPSATATIDISASSYPTFQASASGTGTVTYSSDTRFCAINATTGVIEDLTKAGTCVITANVAASGDYAAGSSTYSMDILGESAGLAWAPASASLSGTTYTLDQAAPKVTATKLKGTGTISYRLKPGAATDVCTIDASSGQIAWVKRGTCEVVADVSAASVYGAATTTALTFIVERITRTLTIDALSASTYVYTDHNSTPLSVSATAKVGATIVGGGTVALHVDATSDSVCTVSGTDITFTGGNGNCVFYATIGTYSIDDLHDYTGASTSASPTTIRVNAASRTFTASGFTGGIDASSARYNQTPQITGTVDLAPATGTRTYTVTAGTSANCSVSATGVITPLKGGHVLCTVDVAQAAAGGADPVNFPAYGRATTSVSVYLETVTRTLAIAPNSPGSGGATTFTATEIGASPSATGMKIDKILSVPSTSSDYIVLHSNASGTAAYSGAVTNTTSNSLVCRVPSAATSYMANAGYLYTAGLAGFTGANDATTAASTGACTVTVSVAATDNAGYSAASATLPITVTLVPRTISWPSRKASYEISDTTMPALTPGTVVKPSTGTTFGTTTVTKDLATSDGHCTFGSGATAYTLTFASVGTCKIDAATTEAYPYAAATGSISIPVTLIQRTFDLTQPTTPKVFTPATGSYTVTGTANTTNVALTPSTAGTKKYFLYSDNGVCTINESTGAVTLLKDGNCITYGTIDASGDYSSAVGTPVTVVVTKKPITVLVRDYPSAGAGESPWYAKTASLPASFYTDQDGAGTYATKSCVVLAADGTGSALAASDLHADSTSVAAGHVGEGRYLIKCTVTPAPGYSIADTAPTASFYVTPIARTLTIPTISNAKWDDTPATISAAVSAATADANELLGTITYGTTTPNYCTVATAANVGTPTYQNTGTCGISATIAAYGDYAPATASTKSFTISAADRVLTVGGLSGGAYAYDSPRPTLTVSATSTTTNRNSARTRYTEGTPSYAALPASSGICDVNTSSGLVSFSAITSDSQSCQLTAALTAVTNTYNGVTTTIYNAVPATTATFTLNRATRDIVFTAKNYAALAATHELPLTYAGDAAAPIIVATPTLASGNPDVGGAVATGAQTYSVTNTNKACTLPTSGSADNQRTPVWVQITDATYGCTVQVQVAAVAGYKPVTESVPLTITAVARTITASDVGTKIFTDAPSVTSSLTSTSSMTASLSSGTKSYSVDPAPANTAVCSINPSTGALSFSNVGTCKYYAHIAQYGLWAEATSTARTITVDKAPITVTASSTSALSQAALPAGIDGVEGTYAVTEVPVVAGGSIASQSCNVYADGTYATAMTQSTLLPAAGGANKAYPIHCTYTAKTGFEITPVDGVYTVTARPRTMTASPMASASPSPTPVPTSSAYPFNAVPYVLGTAVDSAGTVADGQDAGTKAYRVVKSATDHADPSVGNTNCSVNASTGVISPLKATSGGLTCYVEASIGANGAFAAVEPSAAPAPITQFNIRTVVPTVLIGGQPANATAQFGSSITLNGYNLDGSSGAYTYDSVDAAGATGAGANAVCTVTSSGAVTLVSAEEQTCRIKVTIAAWSPVGTTGGYDTASSTATFTVTSLDRTASLSVPTGAHYDQGTGSVTVNTTLSDAGQQHVFVDDGLQADSVGDTTGVCTVAELSGEVTYHGVGTCRVRGYRSASAGYNASPMSEWTTFEVAKSEITVRPANANYTLTAHQAYTALQPAALAVESPAKYSVLPTCSVFDGAYAESSVALEATALHIATPGQTKAFTVYCVGGEADANHTLAAARDSATLTLSPITTELSIDTSSYAGSPYAFNATPPSLTATLTAGGGSIPAGDSPPTPTFSESSASCTVSPSGAVTFDTFGTCSVTAGVSAWGDYYGITSDPASISITRVDRTALLALSGTSTESQAFAFTADPPTPSVTVSALLPGGGPDSGATSITGATYSVSNAADELSESAVCSMNSDGTGLAFLKNGSCTMSVTVPADRGYTSATDTITFDVTSVDRTALLMLAGNDADSQLFAFNATPPAVTVSISGPPVGGEPDADSTSTAGATFAVSNAATETSLIPVCSIDSDGTDLTFLKNGLCTMSVTVPADRGYQADTDTVTFAVTSVDRTAVLKLAGDGTDANRAFAFNTAPPAVSVAISALLPSSEPDLGATSTTGATYLVTNVIDPFDPVCSIDTDGTDLTYLKDGSCTLQVTVPADRGYQEDVDTITFTIQPVNLTVAVADTFVAFGNEFPDFAVTLADDDPATIASGAITIASAFDNPLDITCSVYDGAVDAANLRSHTQIEVRSATYRINCTGTPKAGYAVVAYDDGELTVKNGRSALIQTAASVGGTAVLASTPSYTLDQGSSDIALVISSASVGGDTVTVAVEFAGDPALTPCSVAANGDPTPAGNPVVFYYRVTFLHAGTCVVHAVVNATASETEVDERSTLTIAPTPRTVVPTGYQTPGHFSFADGTLQLSAHAFATSDVTQTEQNNGGFTYTAVSDAGGATPSNDVCSADATTSGLIHFVDDEECYVKVSMTVSADGDFAAASQVIHFAIDPVVVDVTAATHTVQALAAFDDTSYGFTADNAKFTSAGCHVYEQTSVDPNPVALSTTPVASENLHHGGPIYRVMCEPTAAKGYDIGTVTPSEPLIITQISRTATASTSLTPSTAPFEFIDGTTASTTVSVADTADNTGTRSFTATSGSAVDSGTNTGCSVDTSTGAVTVLSTVSGDVTCYVHATIGDSTTGGYSDYAPVTKTASFTVSDKARTLTISSGPASSGYFFNETPAAVVTSVTSGDGVGTVSYHTVTSLGVASTAVCEFVTGNQLVFHALGECYYYAAITASSGFEAAATAATANHFPVKAIERSITVDNAATYAFDATKPTLTATAGLKSAGTEPDLLVNSGARSFSKQSGAACSVSSPAGEVDWTNSGLCTIRVTVAASTYYAEAFTDITFEVTAVSVNVVANVASTTALALPTGLTTVSTTHITSPGCYIYLASDETKARIDEASGVHVYDASGTDTTSYKIHCVPTFAPGYALGTNTDSVLTVTQASRTVSFSGTYPTALAPDWVFTTTRPTPTASVSVASAGLSTAVSFSSQTTSVCTIDGTDITYHATGTCTIRASIGAESPAGANLIADYAAAHADKSWTVAYKVTYDTNGGSAASAGYYVEGGTLVLPAASTLFGYDFAGWYDAASGGTLWGAASATTTAIVERGDFTIHAQWTPTNWTVTYNTEGGSAQSSGTYATGGTITLPAAPTKTGYDFAGWFSAGTGGTKLGDAEGAYTPVSPWGNQTIHAQWAAKTWNVTYTTHGDTTENATTYTTGSTVTLPAAPTLVGYDFAGWYSASSGGTKYGNASASFTPSSPWGHLDIHGQWTAHVWTVTYDWSSATTNGSGGSATYATTAAITLPTTHPQRTGYTFAGWKWAWTANLASTNTVGSTGAAETSYTPQTPWGDITLIAQWTANTYTVTYSWNSATTNGSGGSATYTVGGSAITLPTTAPQRTGYTFTGYKWAWDTSLGTTAAVGSNGASETAYTPVSPYGNITLTAQWSANSYTLAFNGSSPTSGTAPTSINYTAGTAFSLPSTAGTLAKTGYTFGGWTVASDGSGTVYAPSESVTFYGTTTLYAKWNINRTFTINAPSTTTAGSTGVTMTWTLNNSPATGMGTVAVSVSSSPARCTITSGASVTGNSGTVTFSFSRSNVGDSCTFSFSVGAVTYYSSATGSRSVTST